LFAGQADHAVAKRIAAVCCRKESRERPPMRRLTTAFSACLLVSLAAGCTREGPAYAPKPAEVAAVVEMTNTFSFSPETVRIPAGSTVEWRNTSIATHTVTADPSRIQDPEQVALPAGAEPFSSGEIGRGQLWRHTPPTATPASHTTISSA
jgi:plastocyanin